MIKPKFIPLYSREEICDRARSLVGRRAAFPKHRDYLDCLDVGAHAYGYINDLIPRDIELWPELHPRIMSALGWRSRRGDEAWSPGDLLLLWIRGPHIAVFTGRDLMVHACSTKIRESEIGIWKKRVQGVLTWQLH